MNATRALLLIVLAVNVVVLALVWDTRNALREAPRPPSLEELETDVLLVGGALRAVESGLADLRTEVSGLKPAGLDEVLDELETLSGDVDGIAGSINGFGPRTITSRLDELERDLSSVCLAVDTFC